MKKIQILLLVLIACSIAALLSFMGDLTTYDTVSSAKLKDGKYIHLIAKVDLSQPIEYDAVKNPNYLRFTAIDTLGEATEVVYFNTKPMDLERSERLVLKGTMKGDQFHCKEILLKCPSKYKDDEEQAMKELTYQAN